MTPSPTDALCTRCGLCCDGSLFADVELAGEAEATGLEILRLGVEDDGDREVLVQPCAALRGTRCGVYAHRPKCCRSFECRLLQRVRRDEVAVEVAVARVAEARARIEGVKGLLVQLGQRDFRLPLKERCAEALAGGTGATRATARKRAELEAAMSELERMIRTTFLGGGGRPGRS